MDPNEALQILRQYIQKYHNLPQNPTQETTDSLIYADFEVEEICGSMVAHFEALDNWLKKGGFIPVEWEASIHASVRKMDEEE